MRLLREMPRYRRLQDIHLRQRPLPRNARLHPADDRIVEFAEPPHCIRLDRKRNENVGLPGKARQLAFSSRKLERCRENADHCERCAVQRDGTAYQSRIAVKLPVPQRIANQGHTIVTWVIFYFEKTSPYLRLRAEQRKDAGRNSRALRLFRLSGPGQNELRLVDEAQAGEGVAMLAPFEKVPRIDR